MDDPRLLREQLIGQLYLAAKSKKEYLEWFMERVKEGDLGEEAKEAYETGYRMGLEEARQKLEKAGAPSFSKNSWFAGSAGNSRKTRYPKLN